MIPEAALEKAQAYLVCTLTSPKATCKRYSYGGFVDTEVEFHNACAECHWVN